MMQHDSTAAAVGNVVMTGTAACIRAWRAVKSRRPRLPAMAVLLLAGGCAASPPPLYPAGSGALEFVIEGFRNDRGAAIVSLFAGPEGFPDEVAASVATQSLPVRSGRVDATFAGLPYGEYAVSVLHDEDLDGVMATALFGSPREGFGFSGHPDFRFGQPAFDQVSVVLLGAKRTETIVMHYETARRQRQEAGRAGSARRPPE